MKALATLVAAATLLATFVLLAESAAAAEKWNGSWRAAQHWPRDGGGWSTEGFDGQSVRQVVRLTGGGSRVRITLSNRYGTRPLRVAGATIGKAGDGAAVRPGTLRPLTFGGRTATTIPAGRETVSDAARLRTAPLESVTVTLYFAEPTGPATFHENAMTTSYRATGDRRFDQGGRAYEEKTTAWYYLSGVDTSGGRAKGAVVAFGDSLTDGYGTTLHTNNRYPDELAERLLASHQRLTVLNSGINGNLLNTDHPCWGGEAGVKRFKREVLDEPGVRTVIVFEGVNDIVTSNLDMGPCGKFPVVDEHSLIKGYRTLIQAAHARGVKIIGTTLGPFKGAEYFDTVENERIRDAVNHWIRTSGEFDAVVDADQALSNPNDPDALRPAYDSGDHIHPNDAGAKAIAAAVDLNEL